MISRARSNAPPVFRLAASPVLLVSLLLGWLLLGAGCGHPASREECEEIFDKSADVELRAQHITDPKVIAQRTAEARAARGDDLMARCLGKRITQSALECVRTATTAEQLDKCLD